MGSNLHPEHVVDAIWQLEAATNSQDLVERLNGLLTVFGIKGLWLASVTPLGINDTVISKQSGMPKDYLKHYLDQRYDRVSPVIEAMKRGDNFVIWDQVRPEGSSDQALLARQCIEESRDAGLDFGLTVPIRAGDRLSGWASIAFTGGSPDPHTVQYIHIIALAAHQRFVAFAEIEKDAHLSPRELEVINWAAEGKTGDETADILGVSKRTVQAHLEHAMFKLNATNKTQAVVKAMRRRFIR